MLSELIIALEQKHYFKGEALFESCHFQIEGERIWHTERLAQLLLGDEVQTHAVMTFINNTLEVDDAFSDHGVRYSRNPAIRLADNLLDGYSALIAPNQHKILIVKHNDEILHYSVEINRGTIAISRVPPALQLAIPAVRFVPQEELNPNIISIRHPFIYRLSST